MVSGGGGNDGGREGRRCNEREGGREGASEREALGSGLGRGTCLLALRVLDHMDDLAAVVEHAPLHVVEEGAESDEVACRRAAFVALDLHGAVVASGKSNKGRGEESRFTWKSMRGRESRVGGGQIKRKETGGRGGK